MMLAGGGDGINALTQPRTQGALRFSTLEFQTREDYPGAGGHFFCRILKMGLGVVVFSVLEVSPIESFDSID